MNRTMPDNSRNSRRSATAAGAKKRRGKPPAKPPTDPPDGIWRSLLLATAIVAVTLVVYIPAMSGEPVWDDLKFLTKSPQEPVGRLVQADDGLYRIWFTGETSDYWPLTETTFWLEWRLWGMDTTGYHVVNILLHAVAAVLVWRILKRLGIPGAPLAGMIFAVHPVCVASVAWIIERKNTLSMVFYLLTVLAYLHHQRRGAARWYLLALAAFALALLSKTSVVMLPVVLLGITWWQRGRITVKDMLLSVPFFALSLGMSVATLCFQRPQIIADWADLQPGGLAARLANAGWVVGFYLYKAAVPTKLSIIYHKWPVEVGSVVFWLPLAAWLACLVVLWVFRRSWGRAGLFALGYFVAALVPVLGFFNMMFMQHSWVSDHLQYVAIVGIIALGAGVWARWCLGRRSGPASAGPARGIRLPDARTVTAWTVASLVVVVLAALTWRQAGIYKTDESVWKDTLAKNRTAAMAHYNLGRTRGKEGEVDEAEHYFRKAIKYRPNFVIAHNSLGNALAKQGDLDGAAECFRTAIRIQPSHAGAQYNLARVYLKWTKLDESEKHFRLAAEAAPDYADAHYGLGYVLGKQGKLDKAMESLRAAIRAMPNHAGAYNDLGVIHFERGEFNEAIENFQMVVRILPRSATAHLYLAKAYSRMGRRAEAAEHVRLARQRR